MAEQTLKLLASAYSTTNATVTNASNAYTDTSSSTTATMKSSASGNGQVYFSGFDFSQIPLGATISSVSYKIKAKTSSINPYIHVCLADKSTAQELSAEQELTNSAVTYTCIPTSATWSDIVALGNNFAFRVNTRGTSNTISVYGIEVNITYEIEPKINKVDYIKGGVLKTLIDLTNDDILPEDVTAGKIFHLANGEQAVGTGGGLEYETGTWSPSSNTTTAPTINFTNTHTESPAVIAFADVSTSSRASNYFISYTYTNLELLIPDWAMPSGGSWKNRYHYYVYASSTSSETAVAPTSANISVSSTSFTPYTNATSLRSSRVYNWIAIWV